MATDLECMHPVEIFWTITIGHNPPPPAAVFGPSKEKLPASFAGNKENQVWRTAQGKGGGTDVLAICAKRISKSLASSNCI